MTNGGVDRSIECSGSTSAMISAFECVHDVFSCSTDLLFGTSTYSLRCRILISWKFDLQHQGWGVAVLVGVPHKDAVFKTHPVNFLVERTLKGTFYGNYKPRSDIPAVVEKYMAKVNEFRTKFSYMLGMRYECNPSIIWQELELEKFITHSVPFSEINKAFDYMLKGESLRCIIHMDG